ncbi:hypothetical protein B0O80DRAFT_428521 [Mortierella sp. GBAus27b]|nr:hypothetical protein BGX31_002193 [Mortierella sp. GBA43]KAI8350574.1 hypothetical protein B0O80DRAFT_428521 [Mortierella sp. GBAus27b]
MLETEKEAPIKKHEKSHLKAFDEGGVDGDDDNTEEDVPEEEEDKDDRDEDDLEATLEEQDSEDSEEEVYRKSNDEIVRFSDRVTPLLAPKMPTVELAGNEKCTFHEDPILRRVERLDTDDPDDVRKEKPMESKKLDMESLTGQAGRSIL